jgi:HEAT repeat protein
MGDAKAEPLLLKLLESGTPDIRALAAVGLGLTGNTKHSEALAKLARSPELGPLARAAAAHALGELGDASQRSLLLALTESSDAQVQVASLLGLARLEASPPARGVAGGARRALRAEGIPADLAPVVARALLSERGALRKTAMAVASALSTGEYRRVGNAMPVPHGVVTLTETLARMAPEGYSREEQVRALIGLADPLASAASAAVATSSERASIVAELVLGKLNTLVDGAPVTSSASDGKLPAVADAIARASVRGFVALASHPSGEVRKRAVEFLAHRDEPAAREAIVGALDERDSEVCRTALSALQKPEGDKTLDAIVALLEKADNWSLRSRAAEALGRAASTGASGDVGKRIDAALARAAEKDRFALVREASLRALARRDPAAAAPLARAIAARDGEPRLRAVAGELINQTAPK